jgi:hypothetical protein
MSEGKKKRSSWYGLLAILPAIGAHQGSGSDGDAVGMVGGFLGGSILAGILYAISKLLEQQDRRRRDAQDHKR